MSFWGQYISNLILDPLSGLRFKNAENKKKIELSYGKPSNGCIMMKFGTHVYVNEVRLPSFTFLTQTNDWQKIAESKKGFNSFLQFKHDKSDFLIYIDIWVYVNDL